MSSGNCGSASWARADHPGRHLPGFPALPGVRVVGVCNLQTRVGRAGRARVQHPQGLRRWEDLVEDDTSRRGRHRRLALPALPDHPGGVDAGKHVLTQTRMAMNAREAQRMLDAPREHPELTAMIVPSPYGLAGDASMHSLIEAGFLGTLREVHVHGLSSDLADPKTPLGWRQMTKYSGFNMLSLGILYETALRWAPPADRVMAFASKRSPPARPRDRQARPRRHARQRAGADDPGRRLERDLSAQRRGLARHRPGHRDSTAARGRCSTT